MQKMKGFVDVAERMLSKHITKLKRSKRFIDYEESGDFADSLALIREGIIKLSETDPSIAIDLMLEFIKTSNVSLNRCDDSNGDVSREYMQACSDLGTIALAAAISVDAAVSIVCDFIEYDEFSACDYIISDFKDVLQEEGLSILKNEVIKLLDPTRIQRKSLEKSKQGDDCDLPKESLTNIYEHERDSALYKVRHCLREIADNRSDVDEYIHACVYPKTDYTMNDFSISDKLKIAERLIKNCRGQETLKWIENEEKFSDLHFDSIMDLKTKALDLTGDFQKAHQTRLEWFQATLKYDVFKQIVQHLTEDKAKKFTEEAVRCAFSFKSVYDSLNFLMHCNFLDKCSELVQERIDDISGRNYQLLRTLARTLQKNRYFLSCALLYRKLAEDLTAMANSKYYKYASKDLYACEELDEHISDYGKFESHDEFYSRFSERHRLKKAFWSAYGSVIQSNIDKAKNRL